MYFILNRAVFKGQWMLVFNRFIATGGKLQRQVKMQEICRTVWMMDPENILWDVCLHNVLPCKGHLQIKSMKMLMLLKPILAEPQDSVWSN